MPSYRYTREIKPEDLQPDSPPEYTRRQKADNWWRYHWKLLVVCAAGLVLVVSLLVSILFRDNPDLVVGVLAPGALPETLTDALAQAIGDEVGDLNGDGKTLVQIDVYTLDFSDAGQYDESGVPIQAGSNPSGLSGAGGDSGGLGAVNTVDPYSQMAGVTRLTATLSAGDVMIFIADPGQADIYQQNYGLFGTQNGAMDDTAGAEALTVPFSELAALKDADLTFDWYDTPIDGRAILADYRVGLRPFTGTKLEKDEGGAERWEAARALLEKLKGG